jgi:hypothetical protein
MIRTLRRSITAPLFALCALCGLNVPLNAADVDVLVYCATPGGVAAAVAAAKGGHEVLAG